MLLPTITFKLEIYVNDVPKKPSDLYLEILNQVTTYRNKLPVENVEVLQIQTM